ncbi:MAG: hypothetical protein K8W52_26120 [Deltaproteobacteria bacterium]|nr:hypothetical protein [Deltaproteobacteria bacterium]
MHCLRGLALLAVLVAAACSDTPAPAADASPGAGPDADLGPQITLDAAARYVAVMPEGGAWQVLAPDAAGRYAFARPEGPYTLVYVCPSNLTTDIEMIQAGPADGDAWGDVCAITAPMAPLDITTGFTASVFVGRSSWTVPNTGTTSGPVGVHDIGLLVRAETPVVSIVRDLSIDGPTQLASSLADYHTMFVSEIALTGDVGAEAFSETEMTIGHDTWMQLVLPRPAPDRLWLVPPELLRAGDVQVHRFVSSSHGAGQWAEVDRGPGRGVAPVPVTLAGTLSSASVSVGARPTITYAAPGGWTEVRAEITGEPSASGQPRWVLTAHPGWLASHPLDGTVVFPDVTTAPGWDARWTVTAADGWAVRLGETVSDGVRRGVQYVVPAI